MLFRYETNEIELNIHMHSGLHIKLGNPIRSVLAETEAEVYRTPRTLCRGMYVQVRRTVTILKTSRVNKSK